MTSSMVMMPTDSAPGSTWLACRSIGSCTSMPLPDNPPQQPYHTLALGIGQAAAYDQQERFYAASWKAAMQQRLKNSKTAVDIRGQRWPVQTS